jgi:TonB family protein
MPAPADHVEGYIRTTEADPELREPRLGLSLSQRKLLTLIEATRSVADITVTLHSDEARVRRDLARLIELKLVRSIDAAPPARATNAQRLAQAVPAVRMAPAVRLRGLGLGIVAVIAMATAAVIAWALLDHAPPQGAVSTEPPRAPAQPMAATAPSDASAGSIRVGTAPAEGATGTNLAIVSERPATPATPAPHAGTKRASTTSESVRVALTQPATARDATRAEPAPATNATNTATTTVATPPATSTRAPASQMNAPASPRPSDDRAVSVPERPAELAQAAPANPVARPPAETQAPTMVATAPASTLAPVAKPKLEPIAREEPEFPREAVRANITGGRVRARLTVDKDGRVSNVEIVAAEPRRVFDRAVDRALSRWRFEPSSETRTTEVEVDFKDN